jgi:hypothetical protein
VANERIAKVAIGHIHCSEVATAFQKITGRPARFVNVASHTGQPAESDSKAT